MAMKVAQFNYLAEITEETPLLLLDDAFDHLDPDRIRGYVDMVSQKLQSQTFITTANPGVLDSCIDYTLPGNTRHEIQRVGTGPVLP